jgi:hypothetical protein
MLVVTVFLFTVRTILIVLGEGYKNVDPYEGLFTGPLLHYIIRSHPIQKRNLTTALHISPMLKMDFASTTFRFSWDEKGKGKDVPVL